MPTSAPNPTVIGDRLRLSIDHLLEGVQIISTDWTYLYVNETAARHGQLRVAELVGRTMMACYPGIEQTPVFERMRRVMDLREPETFRNEFEFPDGARRWFDLRIAPVPDGICVLSLDVTDRQHLEAERRNTERQLQLSQKMEAIGRLAGGIAHDFNNQLAVISGFADLAVDAVGPNSQAAKDLEEVRNAAARATTLTRQLLAFSRRQVLTIEAVDLNEVVAAAHDKLAGQLAETIAFNKDLDAESPRILGDVEQLQNVIANLVTNARDAMSGEGRLTLRTSRRSFTEADVRQNTVMQAGHYAMLSVSDTGHGMDEETQARIFEPFFTTKNGGKGTGLGLSTVYGIVKQMEGFIWVYSEPGSGTTFRLYFPLTDEALVTRAAPSAEALPRGQGTVLVVDDESGLRRFTVRALTEHGYMVLEAGSAEEARVCLDQHGGSIDLVLTDVVLPGQSGPELIAGRVPPVRALFMSGYSAQHVRDASAPDEMRLLEKPFTVRELLTRVRESLLERPA